MTIGKNLICMLSGVLSFIFSEYHLGFFIIFSENWQGKESSLQNRILKSDITINIGKHEADVAMRVNCAAYNGDLYQLKCLIEAGADPNKTDYEGRSPLVRILNWTVPDMLSNQNFNWLKFSCFYWDKFYTKI